MDFFQATYDFFTVDIYDMIVEFVAYIVVKLMIAWIHLKIFMLQVAWAATQQIMTEMQVTQRLSDAAAYISPTLKSTLEYFYVFTGLSWIFQALIARFVLKFIRF